MSRERFQIAVAGSGFAGSITAMALRRLGLSVVLLERGRHPRFAIGESSTPLANLLIEEIADEFGLPWLRSFSKVGTWRAAHPDIAFGLKRGFTFYQHELGRPFPTEPEAARRRQLMVGASPNDRVADTHWYRPEFDAYLVQQAAALGVDYRDEVAIDEVREDADAMVLAGTRGGKGFAIEAGFLIDATGSRGLLHRALRLPEKPITGFPPTQGLFTHFAGVAPLPAHFTPGEPPYPPEAAAVHHVFDGGWVWVLRFNNGITSAGVAATDPVAERLGLREGEAGWRNLLGALPSLAEAFAPARAVRPFVWQPRVASQSAVVAGQRWALLPSAAGVIDPLLSTGFPLALLGVQRLARAVKHGGLGALPAQLEDYAEATTREFEAAARLVAALYARMGRFDRFKELSLLYFAAASYAEAARRLGRPELTLDFLLCRHPSFGPRFTELTRPEAGDAELAGQVREAIEPIDVAGLTDGSRDPWYPAAVVDLLANAGKLGATEAEVTAMLQRCGL